MPILDIQIVGKLRADSIENLAQQLADAGGEALQSRPQGTWVKVQFLSVEHFAENGGAPENVAPVFVHVIQRQLPSKDLLIEQIAQLTKAVASICGRPEENVHVIYEPEGRGRVAFGGKLVE